MRVRYAALLAISAALAVVCLTMFMQRALCEPAVHLLHNALRLKWPLLGAYSAGAYGFYAGDIGLLGVIGFGVTGWAMANQRASNAKVDRYLGDRLPHHEVIMHRLPAAKQNTDDNDR